MKMGSLHRNGDAYTCKEYEMSMKCYNHHSTMEGVILRVSLKQHEYHIYVAFIECLVQVLT